MRRSLIPTIALLAFASPVLAQQYDTEGRLLVNGKPWVLGQTTMSASMPVVLPSDQSAIPVTQSGTWNIGTITTLTGITNPVAVTGTFWQATQPISAVSLPLPTGAATAALQDGILRDGSGDNTEANVVSGRLSVVPYFRNYDTGIPTNTDAKLEGSALHLMVQTPRTLVVTETDLTAAAQVRNRTCSGAQSSFAWYIAGTWSGTIEFEGSLDNTNYVPLDAWSISGSPFPVVNSTTVNGTYLVSCGSNITVRIRTSSWSSGTANVKSGSSNNQELIRALGTGPANASDSVSIVPSIDEPSLTFRGGAGPILEVGYSGGGASGLPINIKGAATDDTVATVRNLTANDALNVAIVDGSGSQITSFGGGTQYTEADTDASITGTAVMWEDAADTLRPASAANPLPVNVVAGGAGDGAIQDGASPSIEATVLDYTNSNPIAVRLTDTSGDYVGAGAGTQYADGAAQATPTGTVALGHDGSNVRALTTDASGDLQVDVLTLPKGPSTTATGSITGAAQSVSLDVEGYGAVAAQVTGTWSGSIKIETTVDGTNWYDYFLANFEGVYVNTISGAGGTNQIFRGNIGGFKSVRLRCDTYSSGTASVTMIGVPYQTYEQPRALGTMLVPADGFQMSAAHVGTFGYVYDPGATLWQRLRGTTTYGSYSDLRGIGGAAVSTGNGASGTGVQRVTLANDSTGVLASVGSITNPVTVAQATASNLNATVTATDLDIRNLVHTADSIQIGDGAETASVRDTGASNSLNVAVVDASGNQITSFGGAASNTTQSGALTGTACATGGPPPTGVGCITISTAGMTSFGLSVPSGGTGVMTVTAEFSIDGGTTWNPTYMWSWTTSLKVISFDLTNPNTAARYSILVGDGSTHVRLKVSAFTSGSSTLTLSANSASFPVWYQSSIEGIPPVVGVPAMGIDASGNAHFAEVDTAQADDETNNRVAMHVDSRLSVFDGTTWDRARGTSADGLLVNLGTNNDVTVTGTVAISQTTTANDVDIATMPNVTIGTFPDNEPFNLAQVAGATVATGNGTAAGSVRVALASDGTGQLSTVTTVGTVTNLTNLPNEGQQTAANSISVTPDTDNDAIGAPAAAVPGEAIQVGGTDGTNLTVPYIDPCQREARTQFVVDIVTATTTEIANAVASEFFYICSVNLVAGGADNVAIVEDDTDACASPTAGVNGGVTAAEGWNFAANGGLTMGNGQGWILKTTTANRYLCIITSAAVQLSGTITYVSAP